MQTDIDGLGAIKLNITRAWAPIGADHLHALVLDGFYDGAAFFRVVGGFVLQVPIESNVASDVPLNVLSKDFFLMPQRMFSRMFPRMLHRMLRRMLH